MGMEPKFDTFKIMTLEEFSMINYQYNNILEHEKDFDNKEISNNVIPFYYIASVFCIPIVLGIVTYTGKTSYQFFISILTIVVLLTLLFTPKRKFIGSDGKTVQYSGISLFMACAGYVIGSFRELLRSVNRTVNGLNRKKSANSTELVAS